MASSPIAAANGDRATMSVSVNGGDDRVVTEAESLTARLDRLPMTRSLWIMAVLLTFGGFFDGYAIGLIGALGPGLFKAGIFTATTVSFFGMSGFASFVAALFAGFFIATLLCHLSPIISAAVPFSLTRCFGSASPTSSWACKPPPTASTSGGS